MKEGGSSLRHLFVIWSRPGAPLFLNSFIRQATSDVLVRMSVERSSVSIDEEKIVLALDSINCLKFSLNSGPWKTSKVFSSLFLKTYTISFLSFVDSPLSRRISFIEQLFTELLQDVSTFLQRAEFEVFDEFNSWQNFKTPSLRNFFIFKVISALSLLDSILFSIFLVLRKRLRAFLFFLISSIIWLGKIKGSLSDMTFCTIHSLSAWFIDSSMAVRLWSRFDSEVISLSSSLGSSSDNLTLNFDQFFILTLRVFMSRILQDWYHPVSSKSTVLWSLPKTSSSSTEKLFTKFEAWLLEITRSIMLCLSQWCRGV